MAGMTMDTGGSTLERIQQIELEISRTQKNKALAVLAALAALDMT